MCGICGYSNSDGCPASEKVIKKMTDAIAHRGPDGEGCYLDGCLGIGHRRLSIIDLTDMASQPMHSEDDRFILAYNGEIYNYRELRTELQKCGYSFPSTGDTMVLLRAYQEWGSKCLDKLNGMFAFVIYDRKKKTLFCARDRYGIKPFYYAVINNTLVFGSEQKAIYAHPAFRHMLDVDAVAEYFTFQNILSDRTFEKTIKILKPGHYFIWDIMHPKNHVEPVQYWDFHFCPEERYATEQEYYEEINQLLDTAIKRQMISDVSMGSYLSGGMDSGTIACIASHNIPHLCTFTCGYDLSGVDNTEMGLDERDLAELMAHEFRTCHYERIFGPWDIEQYLPKVVWSMEEPRVGMSLINYSIAELAAKYVKVCFSGAGGDELFGGYPWRYCRGMGVESFDRFAKQYLAFWQRIIPVQKLPNTFSPVWKDVTGEPEEIYRSILAGQGVPQNEDEYLCSMMYFEAKTFLSGILQVEDKLGMANSMESRVPLLDNDLVDFAMHLPNRLRLQNVNQMRLAIKKFRKSGKTEFYFESNSGKYLLRKSMQRYLPPEVVSAKKQGFSAPVSFWSTKECKGFIESCLAPKARLWDVINRKTVFPLVQDHLNGKANSGAQIWSLLCFEQVLKTWF